MTSTGRIDTSERSDSYSFELRPQDKRILELRMQGCSMQKISDILGEEGMYLTKSTVCEHVKELRMMYGNNIVDAKSNPNSNSNSDMSLIPKSRKDSRWYKIIEWVKEEAENYGLHMGFKPAVRTLFYQATDEHLVKANEYSVFNRKVTDARIGYPDQYGRPLLPEISIDTFSDDSRKSVDNYNDEEPTEMQEPEPIEDPDEYIQTEIETLKNAPGRYEGVGEVGIDGDVGGWWFGQPEYVEVWQEKTDLTDAFNLLLKDMYVKLKSNKGYSSLAFLHQNIEELKELIERKGLEPNDVYILYCGDWDPSGENIDYYIQKRFMQLGLVGVHFIRIAITPEQIDKYHLPLLPLERGDGKKADNPNMREFIRRHGKKATHLNAFFTQKNLPKFKKILTDAINQHWYQEIYDVMDEVWNILAPEPEALSEEELKETRKDMYRQITEAFRSGWYNGYIDAPTDDEDEEEGN